MTKINILDEMREVAYAIDMHEDKKMINLRYAIHFEKHFPELTTAIKNFKYRAEVKERLVRILEIRFEKLKQQL